MTIPSLVVHSFKEPFLDTVSKFVQRVGKEVYSEQVIQRGSILIVQVENKYGDYSLDYQYTDALAQVFRHDFQCIIDTTNAGNQGAIESDTIPD